MECKRRPFLCFDKYCELEALRHCLPPSVLGNLEELPDTLDQTYERVLREINRANRGHARCLLQCLTVAVRPLLAEELAEVLAIDFDAPAHGGVPQLNLNWRWIYHHRITGRPYCPHPV